MSSLPKATTPMALGLVFLLFDIPYCSSSPSISWKASVMICHSCPSLIWLTSLTKVKWVLNCQFRLT